VGVVADVGDAADVADVDEDEDDVDNEDDDEQEETASQELLRSPTIDDSPLPSPAKGMQLRDVPEKYVVSYSSTIWGVLASSMIVDVLSPIEFESSAEMSKFLASKCKGIWDKHVKTRHVGVWQSPDKIVPTGYYVGKEGVDPETFPFQNYMYVICYVKSTPGDADSELKEEHDKRTLRHVPKAVAAHLKTRFNELSETALPPARRAQLEPVLNWVETSHPQINPLVARWVDYSKEGLTLHTAFRQPVSSARPKGPNSKLAKEGKVVPAPRGGKRGAATVRTTAKVAKIAEHCGSSSTSTADATSHESSNYKSYKIVPVADSAMTKIFLQGNEVHIIQF